MTTTSSTTLEIMAADRYRDAISHHAAGVAVLTAEAAGVAHGLTVSSVASHSIDPPTLSCNVALSCSVLPPIRATRRFAIHLLAHDQTDLAERFARRGIDRFTGLAWHWWHGLPAPAGVVARFACDLVADVEVGDHTVLLGTVSALAVSPGRAPLVHQRRGFRRLA